MRKKLKQGSISTFSDMVAAENSWNLTPGLRAQSSGIHSHRKAGGTWKMPSQPFSAQVRAGDHMTWKGADQKSQMYFQSLAVLTNQASIVMDRIKRSKSVVVLIGQWGREGLLPGIVRTTCTQLAWSEGNRQTWGAEASQWVKHTLNFCGIV